MSKFFGTKIESIYEVVESFNLYGVVDRGSPVNFTALVIYDGGKRGLNICPVREGTVTCLNPILFDEEDEVWDLSGFSVGGNINYRTEEDLLLSLNSDPKIKGFIRLRESKSPNALRKMTRGEFEDL